jgi:type IV secretory pathway VirB6-like protein
VFISYYFTPIHCPYFVSSKTVYACEAIVCQTLQFLHTYCHTGTAAILNNDILIKYEFPKVLLTPILKYFCLNVIFCILCLCVVVVVVIVVVVAVVVVVACF